MVNNTSKVPEALFEIIAVAIEYNLHLEPNRFINYIDLYCRYLIAQRDSSKFELETTVCFYQFICNQTLLDIAAASTESDTEGPVMAPAALQPINFD